MRINIFIHYYSQMTFLDEDTEDSTYIFWKLMDTYTKWSLKLTIIKTEHLRTNLNVADVSEDIKLNTAGEFKCLGSIIHEGDS